LTQMPIGADPASQAWATIPFGCHDT
jgi:hypothetical protein